MPTFTVRINGERNLRWNDFGVAYTGLDGKSKFNLKFQTPVGSFTIKPVTLSEFPRINPRGRDMKENEYHIPSSMNFIQDVYGAKLTANGQQEIANLIILVNETERIVSELRARLRS